MAYVGFKNGFNVQTSSAIDRRLYLTHAEMFEVTEDSEV